jgi:hypothetical protein
MQEFKEPQMKKIANDFLDFTGIVVSTLQIYNHVRKWRHRCSVISRMKSEGKLKWSKAATCFLLEEEDNQHEHLKVI